MALAGCASLERDVRSWTGMDHGLAELDTNEDGVISEQEAQADEQLSAAFSRIDTNQDGNINPDELSAAYTTVATIDFAKVDFNGDGVISEREANAVRPSLREVFDEVDADGDGNVSETEYEAANYNMLERTEFASFDTDGDGVIDEREAESNQTLNDDFSTLDVNDDDLISRDEFGRAQAR